VRVFLDECIDWRPARDIAVVVLNARTSRLTDLKPLMPNLLTAIESAQSGAAKFIDAD
jgi:hypothetical protein